MLNSGGSIVDKLNRSIEYLGGDPHPGATINELVDYLGNTIYDAIGRASTDVFHFKGSVADEEHLPTSDQEVGDVYNIIAESSYGGAGTNVAWTGEEWDALGGESSGGGGLVEITYSELKALRDGGELVPGTQYRITDYICTVANDENAMVESHPYDIIVTADSESVLNENARAALKDGDTYYCNPEAYTDANLAAWELKYCLDNDANKYQWADSENGKGVVYFLKDDRNNECWYDFKQIKFKRYKITECQEVPSLVGKYTADMYSQHMVVDDANPKWMFTFNAFDYSMEEGPCLDASILSQFNEYPTSVYGNIIGPKTTVYDSELGMSVFRYGLGNNVINGSLSYKNVLETDALGNTIDDYCNMNTFKRSSEYNTFGYGSYRNKIGLECSGNIVGSYCRDNVFEAGCSNNVLADSDIRNVFGAGCQRNSMGNNCDSIYFGRSCTSNTVPANINCYTVFDYTSLVSTLFVSNNNHCRRFIGKNTSGTIKSLTIMDLAT